MLCCKIGYWYTQCITDHSTKKNIFTIMYIMQWHQTLLSKDDSLVLVNKFGQEYQCTLPDIPKTDTETKKDDAILDEYVDISALLKPMEAAPCLTTTKDWWTYEFCYGSIIKQYHTEDNKITGAILILGKYESEYNWKNNSEAKNRLQRFHSQYYVNGTKCDITGEPRRTEVRFHCEAVGDHIKRVDEPESCRYILTVATTKVCHHPYLKLYPARQSHWIFCAPLLPQDKYDVYMRLQKEKLKNEKKWHKEIFDPNSVYNANNKPDNGIYNEFLQLKSNSLNSQLIDVTDEFEDANSGVDENFEDEPGKEEGKLQEPGNTEESEEQLGLKEEEAKNIDQDNPVDQQRKPAGALKGEPNVIQKIEESWKFGKQLKKVGGGALLGNFISTVMSSMMEQTDEKDFSNIESTLDVFTTFLRRNLKEAEAAGDRIMVEMWRNPLTFHEEFRKDWNNKKANGEQGIDAYISALLPFVEKTMMSLETYGIPEVKDAIEKNLNTVKLLKELYLNIGTDTDTQFMNRIQGIINDVQKNFQHSIQVQEQTVDSLKNLESRLQEAEDDLQLFSKTLNSKDDLEGDPESMTAEHLVDEDDLSKSVGGHKYVSSKEGNVAAYPVDVEKDPPDVHQLRSKLRSMITKTKEIKAAFKSNEQGPVSIFGLKKRAEGFLKDLSEFRMTLTETSENLDSALPSQDRNPESPSQDAPFSSDTPDSVAASGSQETEEMSQESQKEKKLYRVQILNEKSLDDNYKTKLKKSIRDHLQKSGLDYIENEVEIKLLSTEAFEDDDKEGSDNENSFSFKNMIITIIGDNSEEVEEREKQRNMERNYNFIWDDSLLEEERLDLKDKDDDKQ